MYNGEDIKMQREAIANQIVKGFSNSDDLLEKAHNHGDIHPNGKWYWESSANGGKGDWRTIKGAGKATNSKQKSEKKEDDADNKRKEAKKPAEFVPKQTFKNAKDMANKIDMYLEKNVDIQPFVDILGKTVYDKGAGTKYRCINAGSGHYGEWDCSTLSYLQKDGSGDYLEFKDKPSQEKLDKCSKLLKDKLAKEGYDVNPKFIVLDHNSYYQHVETFGVGISIKITKKEVQSSSKKKSR